MIRAFSSKFGSDENGEFFGPKDVSQPIKEAFHPFSSQASQIWYEASRAARLNLRNNDLTDLGEKPNDFRQNGTWVELKPRAPTSIA